MDIQQIRRDRLRRWTAINGRPEREKSYFSQLLNGKIPFGERAARRIEKEYGMPAGQLDLPPDVAVLDVASRRPIDSGREVVAMSPSLTARSGDHYVPLLTWGQAVEAFRRGSIAIREGIVDRVRVAEAPTDAMFALRVEDDLNTPDIPVGSHIIVDPDLPPIHGDYVIVKLKDGALTLKQYVRDGSDWWLKPANSRYPIMPMPDDATVAGVVVELNRRFR